MPNNVAIAATRWSASEAVPLFIMNCNLQLDGLSHFDGLTRSASRRG
jgi:hypothetical protein